MTRYIIKRKNEWAVVNANYKKSIQIFKTQKEAIKFASKLLDTKHIVVQGEDHKFRKLNNWDLKDVEKGSIVKYVPVYIYKYADEGLYRDKVKNLVLVFSLITFAIVTVVFAALFGYERISNG